MSSPIDRSFDADRVSPYAPKWARDLDSVSKPLLEKPHDIVPIVPADNPESDAEWPRRSLEPILMPEPPIPEPWLRGRTQSIAEAGGFISELFPFLLAVFLAALVAFVIVVELPKIQAFVAQQRSTEFSFGKRFEGDAPQPSAKLSSKAAEPEPASTARSDSLPTNADRPPALIVPVVHTAPTAPTQLAAATPAPVNPEPANSQPASPAPIKTAPPAAKPTPTAALIPETKVKTTPIRPEQPVRPLDHDEIEMLLKQGKDFVSLGDFASARIVFRRVWDAKDARGALALAATYDPVVLAKIGAKGATPDPAKAREWYNKARDVGAPDTAPMLEAMPDSGSIFVTSRDSAIAANNNAAPPANEKLARSEPTSQNTPQTGTPAPPGSYWQQGSSIMRLEANGVGRKFFFFTPSEDQLKAGAKAGALRFEGQISGTGYSGTAYSYSSKCGRLAFPVSGQIENNDGRVILSGSTPQLNGDCRDIGKVDQKLVFDFMKTPPK